MSKSIPCAVRLSVFEQFTDPEDPRCFCCGTSINLLRFDVGHCIARAKGGSTKIENLRPICSPCNSSMGVNNMLSFMEKYGFGYVWKSIKQRKETEQRRKLEIVNAFKDVRALFERGKHQTRSRFFVDTEKQAALETLETLMLSTL